MRRHDLAQHPRRARWQRWTPHQRLVPVGVINRTCHQRIERRLANLRRPVGEQRANCRAVGGRRDRIGHRSFQVPPPRHREHGAGGGCHRHQSHQILGGQQRRQPDDRLAYRGLRVLGQPADQFTRCIGQLLDGLGDDSTHPRRFVGDQRRQRVPGLLRQPCLIRRRQCRHQRGQLARQQDAHPIVAIARQPVVHRRRRGGVERQRRADGDRGVIGQIRQHIGLGASPGGQADTCRFGQHTTAGSVDHAGSSVATRQWPRPVRFTSYIA